MCMMFSCIAFKSGRIEWGHNTQSHEELIRRLVLNDSGYRTSRRGWVRVEVVPTGKNYSLPIDEWVVTVDEETKPRWFDETYEATCRAALAEWAKTHIIKGRKKVDGLTGVIVLSGNMKITNCEDVRTYGSSAPTLTNCNYVATYGSSAPTLTNCTVVATYGSSAPTLTNCTDVATFDNSAPTLTNCTVVATFDNSAPTLTNCTDVWTWDSSKPVYKK